MAALILALLPVLSVLQPAQATSYGLTRNYQGQNFFDGWNFYNKIDDLTHGNVMYVSAKDASKANLAYVDGQGRAIMRVDNTTKLTKLSDKRNSIRIATKDQFTAGSVWVADMTHTPFGCSVWPAWWSSASVWPSGGEIDTFEGVNGVVRQQMGLHTDPGCAWSNSSTQTSTLIDAVDCSNLANQNQGCVVLNPSNASYGAPFANGGGGVWVTEFVDSGISIWFFERNAVPAALNGQMTSIDTSALGMPVANFPNSGCDVNRFFQHQSLIFDISLCGDYAGNKDIFARTCKGDCFWDYVIGDGSAYNDAYFEVNYVKVFGTNNATVVSAASVLAPASTTVSAFALALSAFFAFVAL